MNESRNRVAAFMAAGFLVAIIAGLIVWQMSLPTSPEEAGYQAEDPSPVSKNSAVSSSSRETSSSSPSSPSSTNSVASGQDVDVVEPGAEQPVAAPPRDHTRDPLLPPNAVVNQDAQPAAPTQVYRPTNVVPTSVAPEEVAPRSANGDGAQSTSAPAQTQTQQPTETQQPQPTQPQSTAEQTTPPVLPTELPSELPSEIPTEQLPPVPGINEPTSQPQQTQPQQSAPQQSQPQQPEQSAPQQQPEQVQQGTPGSLNTPWWERFRGYLGY